MLISLIMVSISKWAHVSNEHRRRIVVVVFLIRVNVHI